MLKLVATVLRSSDYVIKCRLKYAVFTEKLAQYLDTFDAKIWTDPLMRMVKLGWGGY